MEEIKIDNENFVEWSIMNKRYQFCKDIGYYTSIIAEQFQRSLYPSVHRIYATVRQALETNARFR